MKPQIRFSRMEGYHSFKDSGDGFGTFGSFEVFWNADDLAPDDEGNEFEVGWYWWACFPGCLPDGDPIGPFTSSNQAYKDAQGF